MRFIPDSTTDDPLGMCRYPKPLKDMPKSVTLADVKATPETGGNWHWSNPCALSVHRFARKNGRLRVQNGGL